MRFLKVALLILAPGLAAQTPDWNTYHDTAATHALLNRWAKRHPEICRLHEIGRTLKGTPLLVLEITSQETGAAASKPAYYYDGNIHSEELTSAEVALFFAHHVLSNFGKDPRITELVKQRVLFIRPKFNPDGADITLKTIHNPRSTPRPWDEDADGSFDEDPPNDLDGDGFATRMRRKNDDGAWTLSPGDPRIMIRRTPKTRSGPFYDLWTEGVDDDGDGRINEDDVGGIDMNRNFPRNWGLPFEQRGAGHYPLSEPETRATARFFITHPNITGAFCGHTSGGFVYRLPSTTTWDRFPRADQGLIEDLAEGFRRTTGQPVRPSYTDPRAHRHGTLISWAYWDRGLVGTVPEFWSGIGKDDDGNGRVSERERLRFNDDVLRGQGFAPWKAYDHPHLGQVEIGGWRQRFTSRNPPPSLLAGEIRRYVPWMIELAEASPRVVITEVKVDTLADDHYRIRATVQNIGWLPTNLTQRALDAKLAVPVRVKLELEKTEVVTGRVRTSVGHLEGRRDVGTSGLTRTFARLEWVVEKKAPDSALTLVCVSEKGGTDRRFIELP